MRGQAWCDRVRCDHGSAYWATSSGLTGSVASPFVVDSDSECSGGIDSIGATDRRSLQPQRFNSTTQTNAVVIILYICGPN